LRAHGFQLGQKQIRSNRKSLQFRAIRRVFSAQLTHQRPRSTQCQANLAQQAAPYGGQAILVLACHKLALACAA